MVGSSFHADKLAASHRVQPAAVSCFLNDAPWHAGLRTLSRDVAVHSVTQMRTALAFVRGADLRDQGGVKAFTLELAREVARADLAFIGRVKAVRREMEARIVACGGPLTGHRPPK